MPVIFVGDPNQQVYGFRGAQNALQCITSTHTYHLTKVCNVIFETHNKSSFKLFEITTKLFLLSEK